MLYSERKRQQELAKREAQGETFWTSQFDHKVRVKLLYTLNEFAREPGAIVEAQYLILKAEGLTDLAGKRLPPSQDFEKVRPHLRR